MSLAINLPLDFIPENYPLKRDVVGMAMECNSVELNKVVVSCDKEGQPVITFGESVWDIRHYFSQSHVQKHKFNFSEFESSCCLLLELKLIVYGWLFHKSSVRSTPAKPSSLIARFEKLKKTYHYLSLKNFTTIQLILKSPSLWKEYESYLAEQKLSQGTLYHIFTSINHVISLKEWLNFNIGTSINPIKSLSIVSKLSSLTAQQTLTIPERIADQIFGTAITLVEEAFSFREELAITECIIQENYLEGKAIVDKKIKRGTLKWLTNQSGEIIDTHRYAQEITRAYPKTIAEIVKENIHDSIILSRISKMKFRHYYSQLITACYICCGSFSGMRDSELSELTPDSYFTDTFDGKKFHMLQSRTFKFGEKKATWVTAPISGKAIQLSAALTEKCREERNKLSGERTNVLWIIKNARSKPPVIAVWSKRLMKFCEQFNITIMENDLQECIDSNPNSHLKILGTVNINKPWPLSSHQFRRSFAFYTIKHRLGTTVSLKQQYKHINLQITEWYAEGGIIARINNLTVDDQLQELLDLTKLEDTTNKIFNFVHTDMLLSGSHGKAIMAMRNDIPHMYSSWDTIYQAVKNGNLTLHGTMHSYCKNGYNCDMDGVVNPAFCVDCSSGSSIIDHDKALWWKQKHLSLTEFLSSNSSTSPSVYAHCITQIRAAESVLNDFEMEFSKYKHPVEFIEL